MSDKILCPDCQQFTWLRHRCVRGKPGGPKPLTKLEKENAARAPKLAGLAVDAGAPVAPNSPPIGRLARVPPGTGKPERSVAEELALLRAEIEAMHATIVKLIETRAA